MTSPVVIFGGSFDPPTTAHAVLPELAARAICAWRLVYVPAAVSPHKLDAPPTPAEHRLAMLRIVVDGIVGAEIDEREIVRGGTSYTIDTLESIRGEIDQTTPLRLLMGTDQARVFHAWHRWRDIIELAEPLLMVRSDDDFDDVCSAIAGGQGADMVDRWRAWVVDLPRLDQTSTRARDHATSGTGLDEDVPDRVEQYIRANGLYGHAGATAP